MKTLLVCTMLICAGQVDLVKIKQIESSGNPNAHNKKTDARGLFQITPIVLREWNNLHNKKYSSEDLFDPKINTTIAIWYFDKRITRYLNHYGIPKTKENYLIAYHDGIGNLRKYLAGKRKLGAEMQGYLAKERNWK